MPRAASATARIVSTESGVPVGLFGAQSRTTSGSCSSTAATAVAGLSSKSSSRPAVIQTVPVPAASSPYIEYVGAKPSAERPGPPNAWSTCCSTSLEPFAAHSCSGASR
jgi:hypothetical protein